MRSSIVLALALGLLAGAAGCTGSTTSQNPVTPVAVSTDTRTPDSPPSAATDPLDDRPPPGKDGIALSLAVSLVDEGEFGKAVRMLQDLHRRYPDNGIVLYELGLAYRLAHRPEDAVSLWTPYRSRLEVMALAGLASALDEAGHPQESITMLREEIAAHPKSGLLHSELGTTLLNLGKSAEATAIYEKGTQVEPSFAPSYMHLADIYATTPSRGLALLHGETFRLLEPKTQRSKRIGALMVRVCEEAAGAKTTSAASAIRISLAPPAPSSKPEDVASLPIENQLERAFGPGLALAHTSGLSLATLHTARRAFLDVMKTKKAPAGLAATPLVKWLRDLDAAGHLEAYDYWLYGPADETSTANWFVANRLKFEAMAAYLATHPLYPKEPEPTETPENVTASLTIRIHEFRL